MKKIFITAVVLVAGMISTDAYSRERPTTLDKLPQNAQKFLALHFKDLSVAFVVEDPGLTGSEYEVTYTDRTEVDFDTKGEWKSVERKYSGVPESIIPAKITEYISGGNFAGQHVRKIERNVHYWEIELSNELEIKFDSKFNVIGYDD